jgi:hypothetical protein
LGREEEEVEEEAERDMIDSGGKKRKTGQGTKY